MSRKILVIGGTGHVGRQVVAALRKQDVQVRALVRAGSDASAIEGPGVEIVRGDMMEPATLDGAFANVDAAISSAAGYTKRRKSDSLEIDRVGNQNLASAAKRAGLPRYVLCSILACDQAESVPHFWAKAQAEVALREAGVPFVALRPGAFLDQAEDFNAANTLKNKFMGIGDRTQTRWTYTYTADLADSLACAALTDKPVQGRSIDVGWSTGPVSCQELADTIAAETKRTLKTMIVPWWVVRVGSGAVGVFNEGARDMGNMFAFFRTGKYVADNKLHEELLGPVPAKNEAVKRWAQAQKLILSV